MKIRKTSHELLQKALNRAVKNNPSYSLRSLARSLKVSPSFLSAVFKGKKKLSLDRFDAVAKALNMDDSAQKALRRSLLLGRILKSTKGSKDLEAELFSYEKETKIKSAIEDRDERPLKEYLAVDSWYHTAILDMVTCVNFNPDPKHIALKLEIEPRQAEEAMKALSQQGLITCQNGVWSKPQQKLRYPTTRSYPAIRAYHKAMITKALRVLLEQTDDVSFERRLITAISFAANPNYLKKGRTRLMELIYEIADIMTEGDCTEVYQLNVQLFPLMKK